MTKESLQQINHWNSVIEGILSVDKRIWGIDPPRFEKHFNRLLGEHAKTIWLQIDNGDFEIGVYPFAGAINFGVQINKEPHKVFYTETVTPIPERRDAYLSKNIRWTIKVIIEKVRKEIKALENS